MGGGQELIKYKLSSPWLEQGVELSSNPALQPKLHTFRCCAWSSHSTNFIAAHRGREVSELASAQHRPPMGC